MNECSEAFCCKRWSQSSKWELYSEINNICINTTNSSKSKSWGKNNAPTRCFCPLQVPWLPETNIKKRVIRHTVFSSELLSLSHLETTKWIIKWISLPTWSKSLEKLAETNITKRMIRHTIFSCSQTSCTKKVWPSYIGPSFTSCTTVQSPKIPLLQLQYFGF